MHRHPGQAATTAKRLRDVLAADREQRRRAVDSTKCGRRSEAAMRRPLSRAKQPQDEGRNRADGGRWVLGGWGAGGAGSTIGGRRIGDGGGDVRGKRNDATARPCWRRICMYGPGGTGGAPPSSSGTRPGIWVWPAGSAADPGSPLPASRSPTRSESTVVGAPARWPHCSSQPIRLPPLSSRSLSRPAVPLAASRLWDDVVSVRNEPSPAGRPITAASLVRPCSVCLEAGRRNHGPPGPDLPAPNIEHAL